MNLVFMYRMSSSYEELTSVKPNFYITSCQYAKSYMMQIYPQLTSEMKVNLINLYLLQKEEMKEYDFM